MRAEASPVSTYTVTGREIPSVEFRFTVSLRQLARMTPDEVTAQMARMAVYHVPGAIDYAKKET